MVSGVVAISSETMPCTKATGIAAMSEATMADQNTRRDRASARRVETGRSTMRPARTVMASIRDSTEATMNPKRARMSRPSYHASAAVPKPSPNSCPKMLKVCSMSMTSSPQVARANGPTVPRTIRPM